jgi:hypothetical protein
MYGRTEELNMHLLIGFVVIVGLITFAFGDDAARGFVRTCLLCVAILLLAGVTYVAVDIWRTPDAPQTEQR